jgi:predicted nucleic acid-binding protein
MVHPGFRCFFDTSVYIAGLLSPRGAAGELMRLTEAGAIRMVVSEEVIVESDRVVEGRFPSLVQESRRLWARLGPEVVPNPTADQLKPFLRNLRRGDARILCAAKSAEVSVFVTWNTRDFMAKSVAPLLECPIVVPGDALTLFRKWLDPFLD